PAPDRQAWLEAPPPPVLCPLEDPPPSVTGPGKPPQLPRREQGKGIQPSVPDATQPGDPPELVLVPEPLSKHQPEVPSASVQGYPSTPSKPSGSTKFRGLFITYA